MTSTGDRCMLIISFFLKFIVQMFLECIQIFELVLSLGSGINFILSHL